MNKNVIPFLFKCKLSVFLSTYVSMEFLGRMIAICCILEVTAKLPSRVVAPYRSTIGSARVS